MATINGRLPSGWSYLIAEDITPDWQRVFDCAASAGTQLSHVGADDAGLILDGIRKDEHLDAATRAYTLSVVALVLEPRAHHHLRPSLLAIGAAYDVARQSRRRQIFVRKGGVDLDLGHVEALSDGWAGWVAREFGERHIQGPRLDTLIARMIDASLRSIGGSRFAAEGAGARS